ncbi:hypothetical protein [Actinocorallia lasiicapitis]
MIEWLATVRRPAAASRRAVRRLRRLGGRCARHALHRLPARRGGPRIETVAPQAQVRRVVTGWDSVTVHGRLLPVPASDVTASLVPDQPGGGEPQSVPVSVDAEGRFTIVVEPLLLRDGRRRFEIAVDGRGVPLLGTGKITYPARLVVLSDRRRRWVQASRTAKGGLRLTCTPEDAQ